MARQITQTQSGHTVSADLIRAMLECAGRCGITAGRIAGLFGEAQPAWAAGSERYSSQYLYKLWEHLARVSGDPIIGFRMARFVEPRHFGVMGQILPRCASVIEAFRQVERFSTIVYQGTRVSIARDASSLVVSVASDLPAGIVHGNGMLWMLSNMVGLPQRMAEVAVRPLLVECDFPSPGAAAARALRERWPITFGADGNRVTFDRSVGDLPIPSADVDLKALLDRVIERHMLELSSAASFEQALTSILRGMMNGTMPTLSALSAHAGMSARTLQRRLAATNTSFQRLLRGVLRESADEYLTGGRLSQSEIAFLLGYSEESAFSRAYRSWTGVPPGSVRGGHS